MVRTAFVLISFAILTGAAVFLVATIWRQQRDTRDIGDAAGLLLVNAWAMGVMAAISGWPQIAVFLADLAVSSFFIRSIVLRRSRRNLEHETA